MAVAAEPTIYSEALLLLGGAVVAAPLFKRIGLGTVLGYLVGHLLWEVPWTGVGMLVIGMMVGLGLVGFVDDFLKTRKQRSLGLGGWSKCGSRRRSASSSPR